MSRAESASQAYHGSSKRVSVGLTAHLASLLFPFIFYNFLANLDSSINSAT